MGNSTRRFGVLGALVMAGVLCVGTAAARAASINVVNATGAAGSSVPVDVALTAGGAAVSSTQNDIGFTANTPIGISSAGDCSITQGTPCTKDSDCPLLPAALFSSCSNTTCSNQPATICATSGDCPTGGTCATKSCKVDADCTSPGTCPRNETCVNQNAPDCAATASGKGGFFAFLPNFCSNNMTQACTSDADCATPAPAGTCTVKCSGATCTGVRALIFGLTPATELSQIADGTLYTCKVNIPAGTASGMYDLTVSDVNMADTSSTACADGTTACHLVSPATGVKGTITVGGPSGFEVCDVAPIKAGTGDNAGEFGDGSIKNADIKAMLPQLGKSATTDRLRAMDASPVDAPTACGGDGSIKNADVKTCLKRLGGKSFVRTISDGTCTSVAQ